LNNTPAETRIAPEAAGLFTVRPSSTSSPLLLFPRETAVLLNKRFFPFSTANDLPQTASRFTGDLPSSARMVASSLHKKMLRPPRCGCSFVHSFCFFAAYFRLLTVLGNPLGTVTDENGRLLEMEAPQCLIPVYLGSIKESFPGKSGHAADAMVVAERAFLSPPCGCLYVAFFPRRWFFFHARRVAGVTDVSKREAPRLRSGFLRGGSCFFRCPPSMLDFMTV